MEALLTIGGYVLGAILSYLAVQVYFVYNDPDDEVIQPMVSILLPLAWPMAVPMAVITISILWSWEKFMKPTHTWINAKLTAFKDRPRTKKVRVDVPTSYRTSERVLVTITELDRHIDQGLEELGYERPAKKKLKHTTPDVSEGGPPG